MVERTSDERARKAGRRDPIWVRAFPVGELEVGAARTVKHGRGQIAVFRTAPDAFYATDNRCPHEGYPLAQGEVRGCVLTCAWHNFKFDLRDGSCLMGDESVRTYPVRVRDDALEIDVAGPDPRDELPRLRQSLERGLLEEQLGRVARDVVRLLEAGATPIEIALDAARFDAERAEYGSTHALPVAADVARDVGRFRGNAAALPLMQAMHLASDANVRRPPRRLAPPADPGPDAEAAGARLRELVEEEDARAAEALLRGALARGAGRERVEAWLLRCVSDHFLSFGHPLIYTLKAFDLLERAGWQHAGALLPGLLFAIVNGTRHDTLPNARPLRRALDALEPRLPGWIAAQDGAAAQDGDERAALRRALCDGSAVEAFGALAGALDRGVALDQISGALCVAAAERLLRFDVAIDADPSVQDGWLDVVHTLTFSCAIQEALRRCPEAPLLRLLFHAAAMLVVMQPLDRPPEARPRVETAVAPAGAVPETGEVSQAVRAGRADEALECGAAYLAAGRPAEPLRAALLDLAYGELGTRSIVVAHLIKVTNAGFDALARLGRDDPQRCLPALAAVRLLASPVRERAIPRLTHEAIRFVSGGRVPHRLSL